MRIVHNPELVVYNDDGCREIRFPLQNEVSTCRGKFLLLNAQRYLYFPARTSRHIRVPYERSAARHLMPAQVFEFLVARALGRSLRTRQHIRANTFIHFASQAYCLSERRMRMNGLAEINCIGAHLDRQADFSNHVASVRVNDHTADDAVRLLVDDQLGHAIRSARGDRSARGSPRKLRGSNVPA